MEKQPTTRTLSTTKTSFDIIELLKEREGARVTQIANELDLAPSTVHGHLATLTQCNYVTKEGDIYQLGLAFLELGDYVQTRKKAYTTAESYTEKLAEETECRAVFGVEEHGQGVYIHTFSGEHAVWTYSAVGKPFELHTTAVGKSILSQLSDERVSKIIDRHGLASETDNTVTNKADLLEELSLTAERGYALNDQEQIEGVRAVGVPVSGKNDHVLGAFSVAAPANRMKGEWFEEELPETILATANEFELEISLP